MEVAESTATTIGLSNFVIVTVEFGCFNCFTKCLLLDIMGESYTMEFSLLRFSLIHRTIGSEEDVLNKP